MAKRLGPKGGVIKRIAPPAESHYGLTELQEIFEIIFGEYDSTRPLNFDENDDAVNDDRGQRTFARVITTNQDSPEGLDIIWETIVDSINKDGAADWSRNQWWSYLKSLVF